MLNAPIVAGLKGSSERWSTSGALRLLDLMLIAPISIRAWFGALAGLFGFGVNFGWFCCVLFSARSKEAK
jgi:hypothetical protein